MPREEMAAIMQQKTGLAPIDKAHLVYLKLGGIVPNPAQPRKEFEDESLRSLAESIRQYGILQPLTVRRKNGRYELIAGERRLRAAKLAGLREVPCILVGADGEQSSLIALVENLQRCDLNFIEEAEGIARLILSFGLSQEEAAKRIGKSQSAVANKLRILKHPPEVLSLIRSGGLTERHARALLKLQDTADRLTAVKYMIKNGLNVAQSEEYVEKLIERKAQSEAEDRQKSKSMYLIKDVRFLINTVKRAVGMMQLSGVYADIGRIETDNQITLTITIPK